MPHEIEQGRNVSLGAIQSPPDERDAQLRDFLTETLPTPPLRFGNGFLFSDWLMLGNGEVGDCVEAQANHNNMLNEKKGQTGVVAQFTDHTTLSDYSAITGYDPRDPNTDQGTVPRDCLNYRRQTGMVDEIGNRHKIDAYAAISVSDWQELMSAVYVFGSVEFAFGVPNSAMRQFRFGVDGEWTDVGDNNLVGGHDVLIVGSMNWKDEATLITWGQRWRMTKAFAQKYAWEAWVPLSKEILKDGHGLHLISWDKLETYLSNLH